MLHPSTLNEIETSINTGVEYEIALFAKLIEKNGADYSKVINSINKRNDSSKVRQIMNMTNIQAILNELAKKKLNLKDATFETQNDEVGPADIVMIVKDSNNRESKIGLSVKYANTCTLNVTGKKFITQKQIDNLKERYISHYVPKFKIDMASRFGNAVNWHRKTSTVTDEIIDEIRDAVIENWNNVPNKVALLNNLFHADSPIVFWVVTYNNKGYSLKTVPQTIDKKRAQDVKVKKYMTSYVAFYLDGKRLAHMQVKFNNGFIESNFNHKGERKKKTPDLIVDKQEFNYGKPFGSWNFNVEE